jgi:hypothetical protein
MDDTRLCPGGQAEYAVRHVQIPVLTDDIVCAGRHLNQLLQIRHYPFNSGDKQPKAGQRLAGPYLFGLPAKAECARVRQDKTMGTAHDGDPARRAGARECPNTSASSRRHEPELPPPVDVKTQYASIMRKHDLGTLVLCQPSCVPLDGGLRHQSGTGRNGLAAVTRQSYTRFVVDSIKSWKFSQFWPLVRTTRRRFGG